MVTYCSELFPTFDGIVDQPCTPLSAAHDMIAGFGFLSGATAVTPAVESLVSVDLRSA